MPPSLLTLVTRSIIPSSLSLKLTCGSTLDFASLFSRCLATGEIARRARKLLYLFLGLVREAEQMSKSYQFSVRDAGLSEGDDSFVIAVFDASLPYLESIGSLGQWGSIPFSQRAGWVEETRRQVRESERSRIPDTMDALRILILEAELGVQAIGALDLKLMHSRVSDDGRCVVSVGFAFVRGDWFPTYLPAATVQHAGQFKLEESLYVEVMLSDKRTKGLFCGVGAALLQEVRNYGRSRGKKTLFLDGWAGNERKLIRSVSLRYCH
jgi:hypothetical protein